MAARFADGLESGLTNLKKMLFLKKQMKLQIINAILLKQLVALGDVNIGE